MSFCRRARRTSPSFWHDCARSCLRCATLTSARLVECFLIDDDFVRKFTAAPAGIKNHHAYQGGLLEHVVSLLNVADRITDLYPEVDRDLLLTGIFLHDVGKVDELSYDHAFGYTDEGQLVGHLVMGVEMLSEKAEKCAELTGEAFPPELLLRLKHMIVSHHGTHEFGSPKLPMTLEAIALHYLDNLDAKIHTFGREIRDDPSKESSWTPFQQSLGRRLFKGTVVGGRCGRRNAGDLRARRSVSRWPNSPTASPGWWPSPTTSPSRSRRWRGNLKCRPTITPSFGRRSSGWSRRGSSTWPRTRPSAGPIGRA